jgi:hypothetical protein
MNKRILSHNKGSNQRTYWRSLGANQVERRQKLTLEFKRDWNNGFSEVCQYLQQCANGEEQEPIMSIIQGITKILVREMKDRTV